MGILKLKKELFFPMWGLPKALILSGNICSGQEEVDKKLRGQHGGEGAAEYLSLTNVR